MENVKNLERLRRICFVTGIIFDFIRIFCLPIVILVMYNSVSSSLVPRVVTVIMIILGVMSYFINEMVSKKLKNM